MKKITYIVISLLLMVSYSYGQGEIEANQFSRNDLFGTARAMSMGGAFGALGGDPTGVSINPAGIGVYRSSEVTATAAFQSEKFKSGDIKNSKSRFNFSNLGFVGYFPTRNLNVPVVNFGFSYNKLKSFDREIGAFGDNRKSIMPYIAFQGEGYDYDVLKFNENDNDYDPFQSDTPWLPVFGAISNLIIPKDGSNNSYKPLHTDLVTNNLYISERGSIDTYDFTVGASIGTTLNVGMALSLTDLYYNLYSQNSEDFDKGPKAGFDLVNNLISEGSGVGVKLGLIYRPIHEFRFGLAYQSPTWYSMTDIYSAEMDDNVEGYDDLQSDYEKGVTTTANFRNDYNFKTPDKWTASAATVLGSDMIISLDYELINYKNMKYSGASGTYYTTDKSFSVDNGYIKEDFKVTSTVRAGLEYRFTPQFSGRLGYAWMQNPYNSTFKENGDAMTVGSTSIFRVEGDTNYFTGGIGYRFNRNFYADLALVYKAQNDDLYSFSNVYDESRTNLVIDAAPYSLKNNSIRGLLTLGYKF